MGQTIEAVITGDIVNSTKLKGDDYAQLIKSLKTSFKRISELYSGNKPVAFDIFRGDSFQGVIPQPESALEATLLIRSCLRKHQPADHAFSWDARTAIGIGTVDNVPEKVSEGTGEAFTNSGKYLDQMKKEQRLSVITPWDYINDEMHSQTALLDAIVAKWSTAQAEVVFELLQGKTRKSIGQAFGISQAAIHYRVKGAGWDAIQKFIERYKFVVKNNITHD